MADEDNDRPRERRRGRDPVRTFCDWNCWKVPRNSGLGIQSWSEDHVAPSSGLREGLLHSCVVVSSHGLARIRSGHTELREARVKRSERGRR